MRTLATGPQRLALGIAVLSAAALGTVSASAAPASHSTAVSGTTVAHQTGKRPPFAVAYTPTSKAPGDLNAANPRFARCMRAQGVSVFPGFHASKGPDGGILLRVDISSRGAKFDPTSSSYQKAIKACGPILKKTGITFPNPADLPSPPTPGKATSELPSPTRAFEHA